MATGDAERRKIERNLHDGAQQHLVALAVNLRLTKDLLTEDPETAAEMLDQLGIDVKETIEELRNLAHGIYPPLLIDAGLGEALRAAAGRSPLDVGVDVDGVGALRQRGRGGDLLLLPRGAAERRQARTRRVGHGASLGRSRRPVLRGRRRRSGLRGRRGHRGHGFTNMSDRVGAIGGSVHWTSAPGEGTQVRGSLPLVAT